MSTPTPGGKPAQRSVSFSRPGSPGGVTSPVLDADIVVNPPLGSPASLDLERVSAALGGVAYVPPARTDFSTDEDVGFDELRLPSVNIAQKVGNLGNVFPPGSIVLGQEHCLLAAPPTGEGKAQATGLRVFIIAFHPTRWAEKVPGGDRGAIYDTREQVAQAGGTTDYDENKRNPAVHLYQELATALVLLQKPDDGDDALFPFEGPDGGRYTLAVWNMKGVSYTNFAKLVKTAKKTGYPVVGMKGRYLGQGVEVRTVLQKYGGNFAFRPQVTPGRVTDPAFRKFAHECAGLVPYEPAAA